MATPVASADRPDAPFAPSPRAAAEPPAIAFRDVGKRFGTSWVLRGIDFVVERGTIFGLFGPSGSGKTTTLRLLLGLLGADEGQIEILGRDPTAFDARTRARIGYMPQLFALFPELSVQHNLSLAASLYKLGWWKRREPMRQVLELVELWEHRRKAARQLSGGMQRRLQLAAALLHGPELLVVDEPTAGIDPILRAKFWEHFRALRDEDRTLIVTSQYVTEAEHCDRVAVLGSGRVIALGTPAELRRRAMGGEIVEVETGGLTEPALEALSALDGVRVVNRLSHQELRLTVEQAGASIPLILGALARQGIEVRQVRERHPSFEEVFVRLIGGAEAALLERPDG